MTRVVTQSSPFLFCFIVEFSLVGSTVFYNTWRNVHTLTRSGKTCIVILIILSQGINIFI